MSEKRAFAVPLLGALLLLFTLLGFAGTAPPQGSGESEPPAAPAETANASNAASAADSGLVFEAAPRARRIGAGLGDAPAGPGVFRFELTVPVKTVTRAFLTYELAGVPNWTAAVRSINGLPPQGGFGSAPASGMALQVEEVNPRWLRDGSNEVAFLPVSAGEPRPMGVARVEEGSAPAGEPVPYTVRNLRLVVFTQGRRPTEARLSITHPVKGESDPDGAYIRGFVDPAAIAAGPAELFVDGSHVLNGVRPADGTFAVFVPRPGAAGEPWDVEVEVIYPDGTRLRQTVHLRGETGDDDGDPADKTEKSEADAKTGEAKTLSLAGARLDVPAGALSGPVKLTMRRLAAHELPELDSGMTNVTPLQGGIRMGPHGLKFKKPVHLTIPYDPALLPRGMTEEDVHTYFFDEAAGRWVALPRSPEKAGGSAVVSLTDHFTDFINATIALPDEPAGSNFSPNSLKELAKADPASEIVQIAPPEGGPTGDAMLDFPLVVPPGRHGMQPELAVHYDSSGGNGWLGLGWDLRLPSIEVSTLFGVPRYDGSERYLIDGEQLAPTSDPSLFVRRVEGSFERIVRHGSGPAGYSWEVTDKNGVRSLYGLSPQTRLQDPATGNVFRWYLERTIDLHGNTVDYTYFMDSGGGPGSSDGGEPWVAVYPAAIAYTGVNGAGAFYQVRFTLDDGNQRPDRLSSGRQGFKTVARRRLAAVDVLAGGALVRRYLFSYHEGDFRKTLLDSIAATGEDGATELYRHGFDYVPMATQTDGYAGFGAPQPWGGIGGSGDATSSSHGGAGGHGFVGLGPPECQPHGGIQLGGGGSTTSQGASFVDVNGDGLPDRISDNGSVDLNRFDPTADATGQTPGSFASTHFDGVSALGHTSEWNIDLGAGLHSEIGIPASLSTSWIWSHSNDDRALIDIDGDGLPDLVSTSDGFQVLRNDGHSFVSSTASWGGFGSVISHSSASEESEVMASFTLTEPLRQLMLPYGGTVILTGDVRKKLAGGDGVTASIYHGGALVWSHRFAADETAACAPGPGSSCGGGLSLDVSAGDSLYFLADAIRDTSADALLWSPVVSYQGRDPQAREPWGAPVFVFDANADFNLTGYRGAAWNSPAAGTARVSGPFIKQATSDDVTVLAYLGTSGSPFYTRTFAAAEQGSFDEIPTFAVQRGTPLFLRVVSDTPIDPARVQWSPTVSFQGSTDPVLPDSLSTQPAVVSFVVPKTLPLDRPTQSWPAPADGDNTVQVSWQPSTSNRVVLYVQGIDRLITKQELTASSDFSLTVPATAGEPLFFTLLVDHMGDAGTLSLNGGSVPYNLRLRDDGTPASVLSGGYHGWFYGEWTGTTSFDPAGLTPPTDSSSTPKFTSGVPAPEGTAALGAPLWKGLGPDLYVAAEGLKPSRQGGNAAGILDQASGMSGGGLSVLRQTSTRTGGVSAGVIVGIGLSGGHSETAVDLLDMNGDGYPDQVSESGVSFSNGHDGFGPSQGFAGLDSVRESDDANASTSIGLGVNFVKKNGKGKAAAVLSSLPSGGSTVALSQTKTDLIDVNGDGLPDRVSMDPGSGAMTVQLNLGYRFGAAETWPLPSWNNGGDGRCSDVIDTLSSALGSLSSLDTLDAFNFTRSSAAHVGAAFGPFGASVVTTLARTLVDMADVNGDGLPDRVSKEQGENFFRVQLNLGDHWDQERRWYAPDWSTSIGDGYNPGLFRCLDAVSFNGNVEVEGSAGVPICIPLIPPFPVVGLQIEISIQAFGGQGGVQLSLQDIDGDGLVDHVLKKAGDSNVYVKRNQAERVNLLSAVHRPLGSTVELSYERRGNQPDMPSHQWVLAGTTVHDGRGNDYTTRYEYGNDAFYDRAERESYGFPHLKAVLPDGSTVERWFDNHDLYSRYLPLKTAVADAAGNLFRVETTTYSEVPLAASAQARFPARVQEATFFYEGSATATKSTAKTWQYDDLGNVAAMTDAGDDQPADDATATIAYAADTTAWVFNPQLVEVRDGAGNLLRRTMASYDAAGEMVRQERTLAGGRDPQSGATYSGTNNAVWTFTHDDVGDLVSSVDPTGYTTTATYDAQTRTYPVQVRDSFGYVTTYAYEPKYGKLTAATDENGNTIRRAYDSFGRLLRVMGPDDSDASPALAFEYHPAAPLSWSVVHQKDVTRNDAIDSSVFVDSLERVLETKEDAELDLGSGTSTRIGMRVSGRIAFDARGRVASQGQPVFDTSPANQYVDVATRNPTAFSYDALDRVREVHFPHGAVTRIDYGFGTLDGASRLLTTRTDPNGRATRFYRDVRENVRGVEQTNTIAGAGRTLTTRYAFDALSQLLSVTDALGKATRLEWDTLGRNVVLDNPDAGRTEHRYDRAGNLGAEITANLAAAGQQIRYSYTFNRLNRVDYPASPPALYTYGAPGASANGANRIVTVTDESGTEQRSYNKFGNVVLAVKTINSLNGSNLRGPYTSRFQYDSFGRLLSLTDPVGEQITYGFDAGGHVKTATGLLRRARYDYLRHLGYDEFGERVRMVYGNGVETRWAFDPQSRFLTQLRGTSLGRDLQNLSYQHDPAGTVLSLQNNVAASAVPSLWGGPTAQSFQYDGLYQITGATGTYQVALGKTASYNFTLAYDEVGDIVAKNQLHQITIGSGTPAIQPKTTYNWAYAYGGAQPHAPARIGDRTFHYDLNGNQIGWDSDGGTRRTITWDEENHPLSVTDGSQTTRFLYNADGVRTNKLGVHGETVYVSRWFSIRNGGVVSKHVFADDLRVASKITTSAEFLYFYQPDHLGSAQFVTDEQGYPHEHLEYFPSGEIWVDEHSDTLNTPFLFSGKEVDDETGLSYFGARYYDARQGQWISADPILDGMLDGRALAKPGLSEVPFRLPGQIYAYVGNDPENLTDPDGLCPGCRVVSSVVTRSRIAVLRSVFTDSNGKKLTAKELEGIKFTIRGVEKQGFQLSGAVKYGGNQGIDLTFKGTGQNAGTSALAEAKASPGLGSLKTDTQGIRQGSYLFYESRLQKAIQKGGILHADQTSLLSHLQTGKTRLFAGFAESDRLVELDPKIFYKSVNFKTTPGAAREVE